MIGSGELVDTLQQHHLIDEYQLIVHPLILGDGKRLFREGSDTVMLWLVGTEATGSGVVILTYRPTETAATGSAPDGSGRQRQALTNDVVRIPLPREHDEWIGGLCVAASR